MGIKEKFLDYFGIVDDIRMPESEEVLPAKCSVTCEDFEITLEFKNGKAIMREGSMVSEFHRNLYPDQDRRFKTIALPRGGMLYGKLYHCPRCGNKQALKCPRCGGISCYSGCAESFSCPHCTYVGQVWGKMVWEKMRTVDVLDRSSMNDLNSRRGSERYSPENIHDFDYSFEDQEDQQ